MDTACNHLLTVFLSWLLRPAVIHSQIPETVLSPIYFKFIFHPPTPSHHVSSVADGVSRGSLSGDDGELLHLHLPASGIIGSGRKQEVPALLGNANKQ